MCYKINAMKNNPIKVLLINQSNGTANKVEEMLYTSTAESAYRIADDAHNAKNIINWYQPNIIIMDADAKDKGELDLIKYIRKENFSSKVIVLKNHSDFAKYQKKYTQSGADFFFNKEDEMINIKSILEDRTCAA